MAKYHTEYINLFGGPGTGKSTTAAGLFYYMKLNGISVEMAREYAKDVVWENRLHLLDDQLYIFTKQLRRSKVLNGKVQYVICDSPLAMSFMYGASLDETFLMLVQDEIDRFSNNNFFLTRHKPYVPEGRIQTEAKAIRLDTRLQRTLDSHGIQYNTLDMTTSQAVAEILGLLGISNATCPDCGAPA